MKFERLELTNFRQFKGTQELVFSTSQERNVTIVHAENGFGKTTILKALSWVLYGRSGVLGPDSKTEDFDKPDSIINESVIHSSKKQNVETAKVQLTFKHDNDRYILTRQISYAEQCLLPGKEPTPILEIVSDGETRRQDNAQQRIEMIIPSGLRRLLFFNGERISDLATEDKSAEITDAIQKMLGLKLLQFASEDIKHSNVFGKLRSEQREQSTGTKKALLDKLATANEEKSRLNDELFQEERNIDAIRGELKSISNKISANNEAHELQKKRETLEGEKDNFITQKNDFENQIRNLLSNHGYMLFAEGFYEKGKKIVDSLRSAGKIPARVSNVYLGELLRNCKCICGTCLNEGSPERASVESLLSIAADQDFNVAVGTIDNALGVLGSNLYGNRRQLDSLRAGRLDAKRKISEYNEEIERISQELLDNKKYESARSLEEARREQESKRDATLGNIGFLKGKLVEIEESIDALESQISALEDKEDAAARLQRQVDVVNQCAKLLQEMLEAETHDIRPILNDKINQYFKKIMPKNYWAELSEDYVLRVFKSLLDSEGNKTPQETGLSTGERTVVSLVFISSLLDIAKKRSEIPTILKGLSGAEYPAVIDSPFGSLSMFRSEVARAVIELAPQVLLLVSPEQYDDKVESVLKASGRIGKRYYLTYHAPDISDSADPSITIEGHSFSQYTKTDRDEFSEIKELHI